MFMNYDKHCEKRKGDQQKDIIYIGELVKKTMKINLIQWK